MKKFKIGKKYIYVGEQKEQRGWNEYMVFVFGHKILICKETNDHYPDAAKFDLLSGSLSLESRNNVFRWGKNFQKDFICLDENSDTVGEGYFLRGNEYHLGYDPGEKKELVPQGVYELKFVGNPPTPYLMMIEPGDSIDFTPTENFRQFTKVMDNFFDNKEKYRSIKVAHHEGVLLDGPPGTGKTTIALVGAEYFAKKGGIAIWCKTPDLFQMAVDFVRLNDPDINILLLIDELDKLSYDDKTLSSFLSGPVPLNGVMTVYTTNSTVRLSDSLIRRPGRIRHRIRVDEVDEDAYRLIVKKRLPSITDELLEVIVKEFKGMPIDGVMQIFVNHIVYGMDIETSLKSVLGFYTDLHKQDSNKSWTPQDDKQIKKLLMEALSRGAQQMKTDEKENF